MTSTDSRSTIADVARKAGVSKATVSRFLNHRDTLLTREIAARVESAIAALGYIPSPMAQALKRGRSRLIGLVVADISNPFSVAVLRGAEKACQEAGYLVMLFNLGNAGEREREAKVDGHFKRSFEVLRADTLAIVKRADSPAAISVFARWQDPQWKRQTVSLR